MSQKRKGPENQALVAFDFGAGNETRKRERGSQCVPGGLEAPEYGGRGASGAQQHHTNLAENLAAVWMDVSSARHPESFTLVDAADYLSRLRFNKWTVDGTGYVVAKINRKKVSLHRLLTDAPRGLLVDHINGDKLDNRRQNLRLVTHKENRWNSPGRAGTSRFLGVCWDRDAGKWRAQINAGGRYRILGRFDLEADAARAYNAAAADAYGEYARLNKVA